MRALEGVEAVAWAGLVHAYGSAEDVPELLYGLASPDPVTRERALDALHGGVLHQGSVYDSTVACVPFLCALAADPGVADRAPLLGLLGAIGESAVDAEEEAAGEMPDPAAVIAAVEDIEQEWEEWAIAHGLLAGQALGEHLTGMGGLLADPDPEVRQVAVHVLARFSGDPAAVAPALAARVADEADPRVRTALPIALARLARRLRSAPDGGAALALAAGALRGLVERAREPVTVLETLGSLAAYVPEHLPDDVVERATAAMDRARDHGSGLPPEETRERPDSGTMLSYLRDLAASRGTDASADPGGEDLDEALTRLHRALAGRVADRQRLVLHGLRAGDPLGPGSAMSRTGALHRAWRAPDDTATSQALAPFLAGEDEALAAQAARLLRECALPLTPAMLDDAHRWAAAGSYCGDRGWEGHGLGGECVQLLALAGDARAVEHLDDLLHERAVPEDLPLWCASLGPHAEGLAPSVAARLQALVEEITADPRTADEDSLGDDEHLKAVGRLFAAFVRTGCSGAVDSLAPFLGALTDFAEERNTWLHHAAVPILEAPLAGNATADEAVPVLRRLAALPLRGTYTRVLAARRLWEMTEDAAAVLPAIEAGLAAPESWSSATPDACALLARTGPEATPLLGALRETTADARPPSHRAAAALALRVLAPEDREATDPVLRQAWAATREVHPSIAAGLRRDPHGLPAGFPELLRAELADPRRVGNTDDLTAAPDLHQPPGHCFCAPDNALLADCRALLADAAQR